MKRNSSFAFAALLVFLLILIWGNSLLPSRQSYAVSEWVSRLLTRLHLDGAVNWLTLFGKSQSSRVRKAAHLAEFAMLGVVLTAFSHRWKIAGRTRALIIAFSGVLCALLDETLQLVNARTSSVKDIWIDLLGFFAGVMFSLLVSRFLGLRKRPGQE